MYDGKDYGDWQWLQNSDDPNLQWLYERMEVTGKADISDAGMVYYVVTGDETGNSEKLETFLNMNPPLTAATTEDSLTTLATATTITAEGIDPLTGTAETDPLAGDTTEADWLTNYDSGSTTTLLEPMGPTASADWLLESTAYSDMDATMTASLGSDTSADSQSETDTFGDGFTVNTGTSPLEIDPMPSETVV